MADCGELKPTIFVSVPRLYNRIYGIIKGKFKDAEGCSSYLIQKGLASKQYYLENQASYTNAFYDKLVFSKL